MRTLFIGPDFAMGYRREGNAKLLTDLGEEMGYTCTMVDGNNFVTSTAVREAIAEGDMAPVRRLLGRQFDLTGDVVRGFGRGKEMGFPTANIKVAPETAVPRDGIYATWAHVGEKRYMAATSIGISPTFEEGKHAIEAYILDFDGDLYATSVRLEFVERLRDEVKFDDVESLMAQIDRDVTQTISVLRAADS